VSNNKLGRFVLNV